MHKIVVGIALAVGLALPAVAASAGQPVRTKNPDSIFTGVFPAGSVCPFELSFGPAVNNTYTLTYPAEPNGDIVQRSSGTLYARATNDATGKSIVINTSGPATIVTHPDGSQTTTEHGPSALADLIPPVPSAVVISGIAVYNTSPTGEQTLVSFHGTVTLDICAALS
jgi:hypothetical protein